MKKDIKHRYEQVKNGLMACISIEEDKEGKEKSLYTVPLYDILDSYWKTLV